MKQEARAHSQLRHNLKILTFQEVVVCSLFFFFLIHCTVLAFIFLFAGYWSITIQRHIVKVSSAREDDINLFRFVSFSLFQSTAFIFVSECVYCLYQWYFAAISIIKHNHSNREHQPTQFIFIFGSVQFVIFFFFLNFPIPFYIIVELAFVYIFFVFRILALASEKAFKLLSILANWQRISTKMHRTWKIHWLCRCAHQNTTYTDTDRDRTQKKSGE